MHRIIDIFYYNVSIGEATTTEIIIYPNPTEGILNIETNMVNENFSVELFDVAGNKIEEFKALDISLNNMLLDLRRLKEGVYILNLILDKRVITKKIILSK